MKKNIITIHDIIIPDAPEPFTLIDWFLEFAQIDLNELNKNQKLQLVSTYFDYIGPWIIGGQAFRPPPAEFFGGAAMSEQIDWFLTDLVPRWFEAINWIFDHTEERWKLVYKIFHVTEWTSAKSGGCFTTHYKGGPQIKADPLLKVKLKKEPILMVYAWKDDKSEAPEKISFPYGFQVFIELLNGYQTSNLRKCLHCNRIFFIHTRKLRSYCSPFCQKAAGMKRLRSRKKKESQM
jgi:hypothetical protein